MLLSAPRFFLSLIVILIMPGFVNAALISVVATVNPPNVVDLTDYYSTSGITLSAVGANATGHVFSEEFRTTTPWSGSGGQNFNWRKINATSFPYHPNWSQAGTPDYTLFRADFHIPTDFVSLYYINGAGSNPTFHDILTAYDAFNVMVDQVDVSNNGIADRTLTVTSSARDISYVIASSTSTRLLDRLEFDLVENGAPVPEPSTFILAALGLLGLGFVALRKKYRGA